MKDRGSVLAVDLFDEVMDLRPLEGLLGEYVVSRRLDGDRYHFRHRRSGRTLSVRRSTAEGIYRRGMNPVDVFEALLEGMTCAGCFEPLEGDGHDVCPRCRQDRSVIWVDWPTLGEAT